MTIHHSTEKRAQTGFTLVELLIVVAIIGIIAAIAIPNLLWSINRARQRRTMGDLKTVASALEQYQTDNNSYITGAGSVGSAALLYSSATNATNALNPAYVVNPIYKDGWWATPNPTAVFHYYSAAGQGYALCSMGKNTTAGPDGAVGCQATAETSTASVDGTTFDCDIVIQNGQFIQAPLGKQTLATGC